MASYKEEYNGLLTHDTFTSIDADEYHMIRKQTGKQAIPSMGVLTIKPDGHGNPDRAKSCIVVLGNHETMPWSKLDCFTPVVSALVVHLMDALAVRNCTVLKQGDCKNAFCHPILPENAITIIRPPNCPTSKPNIY